MQLPPVPSAAWLAFSSLFFSSIPSLLHSFASSSFDKQVSPHKGWLRPHMVPLKAGASVGMRRNRTSNRRPAGKGSAGDFWTSTSTHQHFADDAYAARGMICGQRPTSGLATACIAINID